MTTQNGKGLLKMVVQQGRKPFGERSVQAVREHDKGLRTPLATFFGSALGGFGN